MQRDKSIGQNIATLRDGMSQQELAARMKERGFKWSQSTVWSVEKGERPLRLVEAEALAGILVRSVSDLLLSDHTVEASAIARRLVDAEAEIKRAFEAYDVLRLELAVVLDRTPEDEQNRRLQLFGESWIERPIERILEDYRRDERLEGATESAKANLTADDIAAIKATQAGTWIGRLSEVGSDE